MSSTLPAMKGRMGNTDYYLVSLKASELVRLVREPKRMPGWDDEKIEEIYQRKLNYSRVRREIAPYLANSKDTRFFGSLIVAVFNFNETVRFTSLNEIAAVNRTKLRAEEEEAAGKIGMLTLPGEVMMAPLDGQHRLKALEFAMFGKDESGKDIPGIDVDPDLATEDISVILVPYEAEKARRIFTRVNRYARRSSTAETYVTDDEDLFAVLARQVANQIGGRLVKISGTTLSARDGEFTTLTILHACCQHIVESRLHTRMLEDAKSRDFDTSTREACEQVVKNVWRRLCREITVFSQATQEVREVGDDGRREIRKHNLLGKPVVQECLVGAFMRLTGRPTNMSEKEACERLNALPWAIIEENVGNVWQGVLWSGAAANGKIITKNRRIAARLVAYMAGENLPNDGIAELLKDFRNLFPEADRRAKALPPRVDVKPAD